MVEEVSGLAGLSIKVLHERIEKEKEDIPLGIVLDSATLMLKSMGFGPKAAPAQAPATINVNLNGAPAEVLAQARDDLRKTHVENTVEPEDAEIVEGDEDLVGLALTIAEEQFEETVREDSQHDSTRGSAPDDRQPQLPLFGEL